jgi:hypothetical protein
MNTNPGAKVGRKRRYVIEPADELAMLHASLADQRDRGEDYDRDDEDDDRASPKCVNSKDASFHYRLRRKAFVAELERKVDKLKQDCAVLELQIDEVTKKNAAVHQELDASFRYLRTVIVRASCTAVSPSPTLTPPLPISAVEMMR